MGFIVGYKGSLNKYKKVEMTFYILSGHSGIKQKINSKINYRKYSKTWRLNDQGVTEEIRGEIDMIMLNLHTKTYTQKKKRLRSGKYIR
jgi:hypothetical protein